MQSTFTIEQSHVAMKKFKVTQPQNEIKSLKTTFLFRKRKK